MLKARVLTAAVLLPPVVLAIGAGGPLWALVVAAAGALGGREAAHLWWVARRRAAEAGGHGQGEAEGRSPSTPQAHRAAGRPHDSAGRPAWLHLWTGAGGAVPVLAAGLTAGIQGWAGGNETSRLWVVGAATLAAAVWPLLGAALALVAPAGRQLLVRDHPVDAAGVAGGEPPAARHRPDQPGRGGRAWELLRGTALVSVWVGWPLAHAVWLRQQGALWLLAPLVIVWVQDMAAFFVGRAMGRRPLAPRLSPAKTWEGALAGAAAGLVAGALWAGPLGLPAQGLLPAALLTAVAGQVGDLYESGWKRRAQLKDSGTLLPGHGGMLDRLDGLLFALPLFSWWAWAVP